MLAIGQVVSDARRGQILPLRNRPADPGTRPAAQGSRSFTADRDRRLFYTECCQPDGNTIRFVSHDRNSKTAPMGKILPCLSETVSRRLKSNNMRHLWYEIEKKTPQKNQPEQQGYYARIADFSGKIKTCAGITDELPRKKSDMVQAGRRNKH